MTYFCPYFWYFLLIIIILTILTLSMCLRRIPSKTPIPAKTMIVLGSGGHTKEILSLSQTLSPNVYSPRIYVYSGSDLLSRKKALDSEENQSRTDYSIVNICRAREVGQSWLTSVFTTALSMLHAAYILVTVRPHLILCNGPGVCVPLCVMAFLAKKLFIFRSKIIYVESICRLKTLSFSGLILRYFVDRFFVQWESQAVAYPGTEFIGRLA